LVGNAVAPKGVTDPVRIVSLNTEVEMVGLQSSVPSDYSAATATGESHESTSTNQFEILLWLALIIGAMLMALMVYRLSKAMKTDS
jgi:hypothetical protein